MLAFIPSENRCISAITIPDHYAEPVLHLSHGSEKTLISGFVLSEKNSLAFYAINIKSDQKEFLLEFWSVHIYQSSIFQPDLIGH